jgi:hypothetical protein
MKLLEATQIQRFIAIFYKSIPYILWHGFKNGKIIAITEYGYLDLNRLYQEVSSLNPPLNGNITDLFNKVARYYDKHPYIGIDNNSKENSPGCFGGLSVNTLIMLNEIDKMQKKLPARQKIKFVAVGSGTAFFEYLLNAVGVVTAMDVWRENADSCFDRWRINADDEISSCGECYNSLINNAEIFSDLVCGLFENVADQKNMSKWKRKKNFFMPVKIYTLNKKQDQNAIIEDTFKDIDNNTVFVCSWPRKYILDYIETFLNKDGKYLLFVRQQHEELFSDQYLGVTYDGSQALAVKTLLQKYNYQTISFNLNTSTLSTIDFICSDITTPMAKALGNAYTAIQNAAK